MPTPEQLFASSKKVFAHYMSTFPVSLDNKPSQSDYYNNQYLNRHGESNKWLAEGGFLRQRPLPEDKDSDSLWQQHNMEGEIAAAMARGVTGFTFDVMSVEQATNVASELHQMLRAAQAVDTRFKIVVMPDISVLQSDASAVIQIIASVANSPAAYRLTDGRLVVSAFDAGENSAAWWESVLQKLSAKGIEVAFVPTFLGWRDSAASFAPVSFGFGDWGSATIEGAASRVEDAELSHKTFQRLFMMPIDPQQFRPKSFLYWEAGNSGAMRTAWMSSIKGQADWAQIVTWNDFSETSEIAPYTDSTLKRSIGTGYYNLNGFYATWFLTGIQPKIIRDVLYYFYRREPTSAAGPAQSHFDKIANGAAQNSIELVALLTSPGELKITIQGKTYSQVEPAGVVSMSVPSAPGTPMFTLSRNGSDVFSFEGGIQIYGAEGLPSGLIDLTYWSGSASKTGVCAL